MSKKDNILQTATRLFSEKGYRNTSIAELAKITGVAEGTIFYHFKTKEELYLAILENIRETLVREFAGFSRKRNLHPAWRCWKAPFFFIFTWWVPARSCF
jgi:AcrR family transcriptional regulator